MNENSGNNLVPRAFPSVHVKSLGTNFSCGNYDYRYFLFGLIMTIIEVNFEVPDPHPNPYPNPSPNPNPNPTR